MRKLYFCTAIIILMTFGTSAQIPKGSIFIGGDLVYHSTNASDLNNVPTMKSRTFGIFPAVGFAVKDNLLTGIKLIYTSGRSETNGNTIQTNNSWGAGLFLRKFKRIAKSDFYLFLQGDLSAGVGKEMIRENTIDQVKINSNYYNFGIYPGVNYRLSKRVLLETGLNSFFMIGYSKYKRIQGQTSPAETTYNNFSISTSLGGLNEFFVGIKLLLSK